MVLKSVSKYFGGINGLLFTVYCVFVVSTHAVYVSNSDYGFLRAFVLPLFFCTIICPWVLKTLREFDAGRLLSFDKSESKNKKIRALLFLLPFLCFLFRYIAYYPGGFSYDVLNQLGQAISNSYEDWHPVIHTLLVIKLPLILTGKWIGSIVLFQIIAFSAAIGYSLCSLYKFVNKKTVVLFTLLICLNPQVCNMAVYPWKDVAFAIGALLLVTFAMNICLSEGEWIKRPVNISAFIIIAALTTLFRHNALLFTIPLIVAVLFYVTGKRGVIIIVGVILIVAGIKGPLYSALDVRPAYQTQSELLGLPLSVIGNVVVNDPDSVDDEIKSFAYSIAPAEVLTEHFDGGFNSIKFSSGSNIKAVDGYKTKQIIGYMLKCIDSSPQYALKGLISVTHTLYSVFDDFTYSSLPSILDNNMGVKAGGVSAMQRINAAYNKISLLFLPHLFIYFGTMHLLLIAVMFAKCRLNKKSDLKRILLILPLFIYNFGTMLLLSGAEDTLRFFFYTFLVTPIMLVMLLKPHAEIESGEKKKQV